VAHEPDDLEISQRAILERIAANLRHWRRSRGRTQKALAADLGVDLVTVRAIEAARRWPSLQLLVHVALMLDVDIQELVAPRHMAGRPTGRPRTRSE
jgi:transcriptional regulator with XRE-family HTH domain